MNKIKPPENYPPEEGCFLRGNDFSPVAVCVILNRMREETPPDIELLTRTAVESGAALAGTLQTENIGVEKIICNVIANPNIRYIVLCGPESPGHLTGENLEVLLKNGIDKRKMIIGSNSPTPYLFNIPDEWVERFRGQVKLINLINEGRPELIREAVQACFQEKPTKFMGYELHDTGALQLPPISEKITWRVLHPEREPKDEDERRQIEKLQAQIEWIKMKMKEKEKAGSEHKK